MLKKIFLGILILWSLFIFAGFATSPRQAEDVSLLLIVGIFPGVPTTLVLWQQNARRRRVPPSSAPPEPTGMNASDYADFCQLVRMTLSDNVVEQAEAEYLYRYLREHDGLQDSRVRHIAIVLAATLADGQLDEEEAEELRVLLGEFLDADLPSPPRPRQRSRDRRRQNAPPPVSDNPYGMILPGNTYDISYCDSGGNISERRVYVREISHNRAGNEIVKGRCFLVDATRSFRRDRILSAVDVDTGEVCV